MRGLDTPEILTTKVQLLVNHGIVAVGKYMREDRCTLEEITALHEAGIKVWGIWEEGQPITADYFTEAKGFSDGTACAAFAYSIGMPSGKLNYGCYDFDPTIQEIEGHLTDYAGSFQSALKTYGYKAGAYGSGHLIMHLLNLGYIHSGWLSQSEAFLGYQEYLKQGPDIVQGTGSLFGLNSDPDSVFNMDVTF